MGARGIDNWRNYHKHIEGLGVEKAAFLLSGPICGRNTEIGGKFAAYKTEAAARADWKAHRTELMAMETDSTRRPWAFLELRSRHGQAVPRR